MQRRTISNWRHGRAGLTRLHGLSGLLWLVLLAACDAPVHALAEQRAAPTPVLAAAPSRAPTPKVNPRLLTSKPPPARADGYAAPRQNFNDANVPPPTRFAFEAMQSDPVAQALRVLARESESTSPDAAQAGKGLQAVATARGVVRGNQAAALKLIRESLAKLPADDVEAHTILFELLGEVDGQAGAIKLLGDRVVQGKARAVPTKTRTPRTQPASDVDLPGAKKQPQGHPSEDIDPQALIRQAALRQLYRAARAGRAGASDGLLQALKSPHHAVRVAAVQLNYALIPGRLAAKNAMKRFLLPEHQHLLNHY